MGLGFGFLGDVVVTRDGQELKTGHARQQCVLAVLAVQAGRPVSLDQLTDRVWGDDPPAKPRDALHGYLYRLRQVLGDDVIVRKSGGYALVASDVDLHRFSQLISDGRHQEALRLWRGEPFAGLRSPWLDSVRDRLLQEKHVAETERAEVALREGRHGEVLPALLTRAAEHPLDERVAGQLMLALHRSGRSAEALERFERLRRTLSDELGTDPSSPLRDLHHRILTEPEPPDILPHAGPSRVLQPNESAPRAVKRRNAVVFVAAGVVVVVVLLVVMVNQGTSTTPSSAVMGKYAARLKAGDLCVTEGRDRQTHDGPPIAVQGACSEAPPKTLIEPLGGENDRIWWDHPANGLGCLSAMGGSVQEGARLEPWDKCRDDMTFQQFRFERVGQDRYRLRPLHTDLCVGVQEPLAPGAEVVLERCTGGADQEFTVERI
ncbi:BTAD domain-containing putative transcriptional regulator [Lentzea sp. NPDC006480]|uniref:BTAD domain-containing putative transcriptional regulator n=1 Tax=Lentzea sp. NPDC006480 TaxID=3157176 RepID=UPI0033B8B161